MAENKSFSSNFGAVMAAVGSAVGLGNIWRFPYICGKYGGGAFLLVYLVFVFLLGMMIMLSEFVLGRRSQHGPMKSYETLCPRRRGWRYVGLLGVITCFFILSQYFVLSGWTLGYFFQSVTGSLARLGTDAAAISANFDAFASGSWMPLCFLLAFGIITTVIILCGVQKGIEGVSKVLMPVLLLLLVVLCVRSLTLPGASKGLEYLFRPDFGKLTGEGILAALGQALFSLSVGMGVMIVYGSYIPVKDDLMKTALWITVSDTLIAVLAGVAIFPAVFSYHFDPAGGPGLVYCVLPNVFNSMGAMSPVFASMFFLLLGVAALTSAISLLEAITAWACEQFGWKRNVATYSAAIITIVVGMILSLSNGACDALKIMGKSLFDIIDSVNSIYLPPVSALGTVIFMMWVVKSDEVKDELSNHGKLPVRYFGAFRFLTRYVVPIALLVFLITGIFHS